jgi:hypothetical protein
VILIDQEVEAGIVKSATWIIIAQDIAELISSAHIVKARDTPMITAERERMAFKLSKHEQK